MGGCFCCGSLNGNCRVCYEKIDYIETQEFSSFSEAVEARTRSKNKELISSRDGKFEKLRNGIIK